MTTISDSCGPSMDGIIQYRDESNKKYLLSFIISVHRLRDIFCNATLPLRPPLMSVMISLAVNMILIYSEKPFSRRISTKFEPNNKRTAGHWPLTAPTELTALAFMPNGTHFLIGSHLSDSLTCHSLDTTKHRELFTDKLLDFWLE